MTAEPTRSEENRRIAFHIGPEGYRDILSLEPRDFYTDEAACALVLEAMPMPVVYRCYPAGPWLCTWNAMGKADDQYTDLDRKTAICEAFLKYVDELNRKATETESPWHN